MVSKKIHRPLTNLFMSTLRTNKPLVMLVRLSLKAPSQDTEVASLFAATQQGLFHEIFYRSYILYAS